MTIKGIYTSNKRITDRAADISMSSVSHPGARPLKRFINLLTDLVGNMPIRDWRDVWEVERINRAKPTGGERRFRFYYLSADNISKLVT